MSFAINAGLLAALVCGCTASATGLRVEVEFDPGLEIDQLSIVLTRSGLPAESRRLAPSTPLLLESGLHVDLLVPDGWGGTGLSLTVEGSAAGVTVAQGAATAMLVTHQLVALTICLQGATGWACRAEDDASACSALVAADPRNCGACGHDCTTLPGVAAVACAQGRCVLNACVPGRAHCSGNPDDGCETNVATGDYCGSCTMACGTATPLCESMGTQAICVAGCGTATQCGTSCVDTTSDIHNCGSCGMECPAAAGALPTCSNSTCGSTCQSGYHPCGSACAANDSVASCGASCTLCIPPANAIASCDGSNCGFTCSTGYVASGATCIAMTDMGCAAGAHLCNGQCASNDSIGSCGTSCAPCVPPANATATCDGTQCSFTCASGFVPSGSGCALLAPLTWTAYPNGTNDLYGVWGDGSGDVYVVGGGGTILSTQHNVVASWVPETSSNVNDLYSVWGSGSDDVYIAGATSGLGGLLHSVNGGAWTAPQLTGGQASRVLYSVWGSGSADVYAAGQGGAIFHSVDGGTTWTWPNSGVSSQTFESVWGSSSGDVYAVGTGGTIRHSVDGGTTWTAQVVPASVATIYFGGVWGSGSGDVYVVGASGTILHSVDSGATWTVQRVPTSASANNFAGVWGSGSGDVYVVGSGATILHSVDGGTTWAAQASGLSQSTTLYKIWGSGSDNVFVVGDSGTILHGHP